MAHPNSSSENPFIIPSLIPPLVSSGQRQDSDVSKGNNKSIVYQSPSVRETNSQSQRLRRPLHTKEMKRKVLSPIENFSSASNRNSSNKKSSRASFTKSPSLASFTKSPSFASPLPSAPGVEAFPLGMAGRRQAGVDARKDGLPRVTEVARVPRPSPDLQGSP